MNKKRLKEKRRLNKKPPLDTEDEIFRFIKIILSLTIIIIILFVFTKYVVNDGDVRLPEKIIGPGTINYDKVVMGTMFNRNHDEYYVLISDKKDINYPIYTKLYEEYKEAKKLPIYFGDLSNKLISNEEVPKDKNATSEEIILMSPTLLKIKNGVITEYITDATAMNKKLDVKES